MTWFWGSVVKIVTTTKRVIIVTIYFADIILRLLAGKLWDDFSCKLATGSYSKLQAASCNLQAVN